MIEIDQKLLISSINAIAATDEGKVFLAYLMDSCRWNATYLSSEDPQVTQFYAAQRGVYGGIRQIINKEYLKEIEFNYKRKEHVGHNKPRISSGLDSKRNRTSTNTNRSTNK